MPRQTKGTTYIVANPRGIPEGTRICRIDDRDYFEGDSFEGKAPERFVRDGFLVEVKVG